MVLNIFQKNITPADVEAHESMFSLGQDMGANWIVIDPDSHFGPLPTILRLRVGKAGEKIGSAKTEDAAGQVLLQNGHCFWQPLAETKWAERSIYTPCNQQGLPVKLLALKE